MLRTWLHKQSINPLDSKGNYSATSNDTKLGTLAVDGWAVTFGKARRGLGGLRAVPNVTAHPSTASVPITVLLYDGPLLCGLDFVSRHVRYDQTIARNSAIANRLRSASYDSPS